MTDQERIDELEDEVAKLRSQLSGVSEVVGENDSDVEVLRREVASLRDEVDSLRSDLQDVRDLSKLIQPEESSKVTRSKRAAYALVTLYRKANAGNGVAALDADGVVAANQGQIGESYAYKVMRQIPDLVEDDSVCWIIKEERNAADNTRVVLDLNNGDVPASTEGVRIHNGGAPADD